MALAAGASAQAAELKLAAPTSPPSDSAAGAGDEAGAAAQAQTAAADGPLPLPRLVPCGPRMQRAAPANSSWPPQEQQPQQTAAAADGGAGFSQGQSAAAAAAAAGPGHVRLFAMPSECNFSGQRLDPRLVRAVQDRGPWAAHEARLEVQAQQEEATGSKSSAGSTNGSADSADHSRACNSTRSSAPSNAGSGLGESTVSVTHGSTEGSSTGRWLVLLDAAKGAATAPPDLSSCPADFVVLSYYKIFGWPTGLGALLVRRKRPAVTVTGHSAPDTAADRAAQAAQEVLSPLELLLRYRRYFGGGTVAVAAADAELFHRFVLMLCSGCVLMRPAHQSTSPPAELHTANTSLPAPLSLPPAQAPRRGWPGGRHPALHRHCRGPAWLFLPCPCHGSCALAMRWAPSPSPGHRVGPCGLHSRLDCAPAGGAEALGRRGGAGRCAVRPA